MNEREEKQEKPSSIRALFRGQSESAYVFGKLEKLAHAVILLTSQSDTERVLVERVEMSVLDSVREGAHLGADTDRSHVIAVILELLSLIRLSATAGIFTQSNASILVDEYLAVLARLSAPSVQGIMLRREELLSGSEGGADEGPGFWRELPSSIDDLFGSGGAAATTEKAEHVPQSKNKGQDNPLAKNTTHGVKKVGSPVDGARSQAIISVVKLKGVVSIRDVVEVISDCSEKTIQRELLSLVEKGVLKKEGERRWSTYRLA